MWIVALFSIVLAIGKALFGKPEDTPFHYFLAITIIAAVLAVLISVSAQILPKFRKIGIKVLEFELSGESALAQEVLQYAEFDPQHLTPITAGDIDFSSPFPPKKLSESQKYHYERLSIKFYQNFDDIEDPNELSADARENYREFVKHLGTAALAMGHHTKGYHIISNLTKFKDLNDRELLLLGNGHLSAAQEATTQSEQEEHRQKSIPHLKAAMDKNPYEVRIPYNLALALLHLREYEPCITLMENSIKLSSDILPWAKWTVACAQVKQGKRAEAVTTLDQIEAGGWWNEIVKDDWLSLEFKKDQDLTERFQTLCRNRGNPERT